MPTGIPSLLLLLLICQLYAADASNDIPWGTGWRIRYHWQQVPGPGVENWSGEGIEAYDWTRRMYVAKLTLADNTTQAAYKYFNNDTATFTETDGHGRIMCWEFALNATLFPPTFLTSEAKEFGPATVLGMRVKGYTHHHSGWGNATFYVDAANQTNLLRWYRWKEDIYTHTYTSQAVFDVDHFETHSPAGLDHEFALPPGLGKCIKPGTGGALPRRWVAP